ncbi:SDR family oxidoreductase [Limobrevibacterium gyesilva]|uniref:SDR family oxidoreductase n=1 Tax=Limobrevibacterium gyesilva TaxID=2991712 RepID=A0AA42CHK9_9PROT|nr:SDR family oxidoreductase [Limobrevibacterium gyesilva]MCW3474980.1 SDR family oxidoreductase [Limobrevibacterium gyesilva]
MTKTALVTGAARGIGAAIAGRLAAGGWRVVLADRDPRGAATAAGIGAPARFEQTDIADESEVIRIVNVLREREGRLDGLVCNAGIMVRKKLADLTVRDWHRVLATNLTSTFLLARAAEDLLRATRGAIVTIASTRAHMSEPDTESYSASKGGLLALTHALAASLGPDIRVNCISPGWIDTTGGDLRPQDHAQHPAGRVGTPEDVAAMAAFLLGPESGFVTGSEFVVDGGMTRKMIYVE